MARNRTISPDFWTWETVVDCKPMTRLLFLGLQSIADDFGVQPLQPRTIRMQVFPGDAIEGDAVRAMIDELVAQGLVRLYEVDAVAYVEIVDWRQLQRVGRRARRRHPPAVYGAPNVGETGELPAHVMANHSIGEPPRRPSLGGAGEQPSLTIGNHSNVETPRSPPSGSGAPSPSGPFAAPDIRGRRDLKPPPDEAIRTAA